MRRPRPPRRDQLLRLANLAGLTGDLDPSEVERLASEVDRIVEHIGTIIAVDTHDVPPTYAFPPPPSTGPNLSASRISTAAVDPAALRDLFVASSNQALLVPAPAAGDRGPED